ncbi:MAG: RNA-binding S4 domain-containing protein [Bacteroidia bacterium]
MTENHRADKWMWTVRLFKTRTLAAEACRGGKIKLNGDAIKPSKELKSGDVITFKSGPITRTVKVIDFPSSRVGAKLVSQYCEDLTSEDEYEKLKLINELGPPVFHTGKGRPTKRDRRRIDKFI